MLIELEKVKEIIRKHHELIFESSKESAIYILAELDKLTAEDKMCYYSDIRPELKDFMLACEAELKRHDVDKGDSWKEMPEDDLEDIMGDVFERWWNSYEYDYDQDKDHYLGIANLAMMLWWRQENECRK